MKKTVLFLVVSLGIILSSFESKAQYSILNAATNHTTVTTCSGYFVDDGGITNNYSNDYDYWIAFCPTDPTLNRISLTFDTSATRWHVSDTMFFFSGIGVSPQASIVPDPNQAPTGAGYYPFTVTQLAGRSIECPVVVANGCVTARFKSSTKNTDKGWKAEIECISKCQFPVAALDTFFIKYDTLQNMSTKPVKYFVDTIWDDAAHTTYTLDPFYAIDICKGDSVVLVAKPSFPDNDAGYHQSNETCIFYWGYGDDSKVDTVYYNPYTYHKWPNAIGYDISLVVFDTLNGGCRSRNSLPVRLRTAVNPIKTVAPLPDMCSGQKYTLNVGYSSNSSVTIDSIDFSRTAVQRFDSTIFIPDGDLCSNPVIPYYSPVTFNEFTNGAKISSGNDVKSLCINMEHSFLGDLGFRIICPNGQSTVLKWNTHNFQHNLGISIDQGNSNCAPSVMSGSVCCVLNPVFDSMCDCSPGIGWNYCFSNQYLNGARGVISGTCPTVTFPNPYSTSSTSTITSIDSTHISDTTGYFQTPMQTGVTVGQSSCSGPCEVVDLNGFDNLIGCPLNGEWNLEIFDNFGIDNGFVFSWWLELSQSSAANWEYQVPLDSVAWSGPFIQSMTASTGQIAPPIDSCSSYKYNIHILDDFGCQWDTITKMNVVCTPVVNLGADTGVCETVDVLLDAGNPGASQYWWEPTGDSTQSIIAHSPKNTNSTVTYAVQVMNTNGQIYCYGSDSINLTVYPSVIASFNTDKSPLEGCEPLEFTLRNTSENAAQFDWTVGGKKAYTANPTFSFPYGSYDIKLKITSPEGCTDSIRENNFINVYKSPKADFGWKPFNPSVTVPTISFINLTTPDDDLVNRYHWKIQKQKQYPLIENIFGKEPSYTWIATPGANTVGDYQVVLDAYSVNTAPSGFVYECHDTIAKVITIINDSLIFPNALTPNGDGINDVFTIKNLLDGQAYPDNDFSIYNRLGKRVFFRQDLRSGEDVWDPAKTNTPAGTYYYHFVGRGPVKNVEYNGVIEVLRN